MAICNFTAEEAKVYDLTLDLARGDFSQHIDGDKLSRKDLENYLRDTINNDILKGMSLFQAYRRNNLVMFEIIEQIVTTSISEDVLNSPFIDAFVEVKNRALGDNTAWYSEGGLLTVSKFAGNHWDTNRQSIDLGSEFMLKGEWIYIHVYDELERFLLGIVSLEKLLDKVYKSINKWIQDNLYVQFQGVAEVVPSDFIVHGNGEDSLGQLCDRVQSAGGYGSLTIAGTKGALRKLATAVPDKMFADSQKEAKASQGHIATWEGNKIMVIPQTLLPNQFNKMALSDSQLFIMGADVKPIKLEYIGDTRSDMDTTGKKYNDMTMDFQVQTKLGMGLMLPPYFGVYNFA